MVGAIVAGTFSLGAGHGGGSAWTYEVTFTNLTHGMLLTPPIFALSQKQIEVFNFGEPAAKVTVQGPRLIPKMAWTWRRACENG